MLKNGYWLFEYISISRLLKEAPSKYVRAYLYTETDDLDITYFLYYQAETIKRAIIDLEKYISDKQNNFKAFSSAIAKFTASVVPRLNDRQIQLLQKAAKEMGTIFTAKEVSIEYGITENTARKDLKRLADLNLFGQLKSASATAAAVRLIRPTRLRSSSTV